MQYRIPTKFRPIALLGAGVLIAVAGLVFVIHDLRLDNAGGPVQLSHSAIRGSDAADSDAPLTLIAVRDAARGAREALEDLRAALADDRSAVRLARFDLKAEIATRLQTWREQSAARLGSAARPIDTARLMHEVSESMPADSVLVADGGFAGHWSGLLYDTKKAGRGYIADRGFASIGYGLPGCIGAALAAGAAPVCGITGDGGFNMALGDLETARRLGANFTLVVINNAASGYVKALQHAMYGAGNYQSSDLVELDYAAIARDFKCRGERIEDPERLGAALRESLAWRGGPSILDVVVTRDPAQMLPAADSRTLKVEKGDRPA